MTSRLPLFFGSLFFACMLGFVAWSSNALANRQLPGGTPLNVRNRTINTTGTSLANVDPQKLEGTLKDLATGADGTFSAADIIAATKDRSLHSPAEQRLIAALQTFVAAHAGMNRAFIIAPTKDIKTPMFLAANDSNSGKPEEYNPGEGIQDPGFSVATWSNATSGHTTEGTHVFFYATAPLHNANGAVLGQLIINVTMPLSADITTKTVSAITTQEQVHQTVVDTANVLTDAEEKSINAVFPEKISPVGIFIVPSFGTQSSLEFLHSIRDQWKTGSIPKVLLAFAIDTQQSGLFIRDDTKAKLSSNEVSALWAGNPRTLFTQKHYAQSLTEFLQALKKKL